MIQDYVITDWLGPAAADLTDEQLAEFARLVRAYEQTTAGREGGPADYVDEDTAAWIAALECVEGELDVADRGRRFHLAKDDAYAGAIIATLAGVSEVQAAADAGISRPTLRKALGK